MFIGFFKGSAFLKYGINFGILKNREILKEICERWYF